MKDAKGYGKSAVSARRSSWPRNRHLAVASALVAIVGALYLFRLGTPNELAPLDEENYVPHAREVLRHGTESDTRAPFARKEIILHPPAGKWFIAAGMGIVGDKPAGWRFFGALFGALAIGAMYGLALRLLGSPWLALTAAALLALDGLWFAQSRVAMLDIYAATFVLTGVWMLLEDRHRIAQGYEGIRWWRLGVGAFFGLALATKWSAVPFLAVAIWLAIRWEKARARPPEESASREESALSEEPAPQEESVSRRRRLLPIAGTFLLLPAMLYVASYAPWFLNDHRWSFPVCKTHPLAVEWACNQKEVLDSYRYLKNYLTIEVPPRKDGAVKGTAAGSASAEPNGDSAPQRITRLAHPVLSYAWTWPWIGRPSVNYFREGYTLKYRPYDERADPNTGYVNLPITISVIGLPNLAVWWPGFFVALPILVWWAVRRRDPVAIFVASFFLAGYVPFLIGDALSRQEYLFYATPLVPFVVLGAVYVLSRVVAKRHMHKVLVGYIAVALALFAFFYPVVASMPLPDEGPLGFDVRMWLTADCSERNRIQKLCWEPF